MPPGRCVGAPPGTALAAPRSSRLHRRARQSTAWHHLSRLASGLPVAGAGTGPAIPSAAGAATEHYYSDRWFDVQEVAGVDGRRKGWYCDSAEPAIITEGRVSLADLDLDVWVSAAGEVVILDEDE